MSYACILKANSHSMSGGSIWASLKVSMLGFIVSSDIVRYDTNPPAVQKQQWHSREAQIELPLIRALMFVVHFVHAHVTALSHYICFFYLYQLNKKSATLFLEIIPKFFRYQ